jgi:hypothetical protein
MREYDPEEEIKTAAFLMLVACAGVILLTIVGLTAFTFWMIAKF